MDRICQFQIIPTFLETTQLATREMLRNELRSKLEPLASLGFLRKMLKLAKAFHENKKDRDKLIKPPNVSQHCLGFCKK